MAISCIHRSKAIRCINRPEPIRPVDYPVPLSSQLQPLLKSLRKARGLTQAQLAQRLGVVQSRVADIERNPGAISVEQLLQLLALLDAQLVVRDIPPAVPSTPTGDVSADPPRGQW